MTWWPGKEGAVYSKKIVCNQSTMERVGAKEVPIVFYIRYR
jgi:hypothetical protein